MKENGGNGEFPMLTHQQARGSGDDVDYSIFSGDVLAGIGNVTEDIAMDDGSEDEVNVANHDER